VTKAAAEVVPRPMALDAVVDIDYASRTLAVRPPDVAGGHVRSLWRQAHLALLRAEELALLRPAELAGFRSRWVPEVWAHTDRRRNIAHGRPGEFAMLRFEFPKTPDSAFSQLVGRPRLAAIVTIDRSAGHFLACKFYHRPGLADAMV
jgi:hypothetical protein